jgi:hypothetical protein
VTDADTGTKRRVVGLGLGLVAATSLAIVLIVALLFIVISPCSGQCSAPWACIRSVSLRGLTKQ